MAIWPFGRRRNADEPDIEPAAAESASPAEGEADVARPERDPSGDWMTVPPVRTSMAPAMPTTFRVQTLPEILTSHQDSRLSSSLGHAVSSDAPSGVIGGLASATSSLGNVSHDGTGGAPTELHEPVHHAKPEPEPEPATPMQRRLTATADAPLAVSAPGALGSVSPPAPALPEPPVSRVLASPGPVPSPSSLGANPLPVARVVDTASSPSPATATPSSSPPDGSTAATTPARAEAGAAADDRVGGFEVDLTSLLGSPKGDDDIPTITPPADLAPPIQRSVRRDAEPPTLRAPVQRSADRAAAAPGPVMPAITPAPAATPTAETSGGDPAPVQRAAGETSSSPRAPSSSDAAPAAGEPAGDRPTVGAEPVGARPDASPLASAGAAPSTGSGAGPSDLPLVTPAVQRSADDGGEPGGHFPGDGHDHGDDAVQRSAETGSSASPAPAPPEAGPGDATAPTSDDIADEPSPATTAPVAGEAPLAPVSAGPALDDDAADTPDSPAAEDLPLVARQADTAAPTLGTDGGTGSGITPLRTLSEPEPAHADSTAALPLAPPEQPGTITPPAPRASASAGLVGDGPAPLVSGSSASAGSPVGTPRPLTAQRQAETGASTLPGSSGATPNGPGPLAFVAQRQPTAGSGPASTPAALRPLSSGPGDLLLAGRSATSGAGTAASSMTALGAAPAEAPAVPLQRNFGADALTAGVGPAASAPPAPEVSTASDGGPGAPMTLARSTGGATGGPSGPATPVTPVVAQRAVDGGAPTGRSPMPLHTAASAVPSTTDLLVKAGLGEKAPDGTFLRSTPPAGVESSFTVQTTPDAVAASSSTSVQRAVHINEVTSEIGGSTPDGGAGGGAASPDDIRKLYLKLRAELEADLRRQLEAKSRYGRYRP